jgi:IS1 family transposase
VKINGETHYLWRAVDHEDEVLEAFVTKRRDHKSALKFLRKIMKRYGIQHVLVTDSLRSYGAAMMVIVNAQNQKTGRWLSNRGKNCHPLASSGLLENHEKGPLSPSGASFVRHKGQRYCPYRDWFIRLTASALKTYWLTE